MNACGSRISTPCTACTSACCGSFSPEVRTHPERAERQRPDRHPRRHRKSEEAPGHLAALAAPGQDLGYHLPEGRELEQHGEGRTAGGERPGREALHVEMARRHAEGRERRQAGEHRVEIAPAAPRVVQRRAEEYQAEDGETNALEDTERAWIQPQAELRLKSVPEERRARGKAGEIAQTAVDSHAGARRCPGRRGSRPRL